MNKRWRTDHSNDFSNSTAEAVCFWWCVCTGQEAALLATPPGGLLALREEIRTTRFIGRYGIATLLSQKLYFGDRGQYANANC